MPSRKNSRDQPADVVAPLVISSHGTTDEITKSIGLIGRWQIFICCVIFAVKFPVAWHQVSIIFLSPPVKYQCESQPYSNGNFLNQTSSFDSKCVENCTHYSYDRSVFKETIVTQWDLVCNRAWLKDLTQTIFMLGILLGNMLFGHLADRYGRRLPLVGAVLLQAVSGIATAFAFDWYSFTLLRFIQACATGGTMVTSFVLVMEIIAVKYRDVFCILYQIPFNLGHLSLTVFGYYIRTWSMFQLAISVPSILLLSYYWLIPESPRWLITVGKTDKAAKILEKAAIWNKLPTENIKQSVHKASLSINGASDGHAQASFVDLFRTRRVRIKSLCIAFNWLVCGLCFFGVSQYVGQAGGNIFANVAISACVQIPGTLFAVYANSKFGRKKTLITFNCLAGVSCLLIAVVPSIPWLHVTLSTVGILGVSISFPTVYMFAGELFPTVVRNIGVGMCSMVARIGSMAAPFIAGLSSVQFWIPPVIFGIAPLIGAVLCLLLPETRGKELPNTLEEGENI